MPGPVRENAFAKINLTLRILGRREDGYHELRSLVAFARIGDSVTAEKADVVGLGVTGPFAKALEAEADNLVLRAARDIEWDKPVCAILGWRQRRRQRWRQLSVWLWRRLYW